MPYRSASAGGSWALESVTIPITARRPSPALRRPSPPLSRWVTSLTRDYAALHRTLRTKLCGRRGRCCYVDAALNGRAPIVQRPRTPPFQGGNTGSNPVGGADTATLRCRCARSRGAVWSARRPVKPEVAGSNPVGTARVAGRPAPGSPGRVAQLAERPPEKRKVTGSTPVPTTTSECAA